MAICEEQVTTVDVQYVRERYGARETVYSFSRCLILGQLRSVLVLHQCFWSCMHNNPPPPSTHMHAQLDAPWRSLPGARAMSSPFHSPSWIRSCKQWAWNGTRPRPRHQTGKQRRRVPPNKRAAKW